MSQIGPYRIERKIGKGGMGIVYAAHDERLNPILRRAEARYLNAMHAFEQHPGSRVLGVGRRR